MRLQQMDFGGNAGIVVDVMANEKAVAENFMNTIRRSIHENNIYHHLLSQVH
jgi:hypothetical protein